MARYLVTKNNLDSILETVFSSNKIALDTETTGLRPYKGHEVFSKIISNKDDDFYFNFRSTADHLGNFDPEETILHRKILDITSLVLEDPNKTIFIHNAKYDLHMLRNHFKDLKANVVCTQAMARLVHNQLSSYSLEKLGILIGHEKDDTVEKYISKHKLYTLIDVGKKRHRKDKHYDLIPFDIISKYGMQDGRVCFELGEYEQKRLAELTQDNITRGLPDLQNVVLNELKLTKTLYKMENTGVLIDTKYCKEAYDYEVEMYREAAEKFYVITGEAFEDSPTCFKKVFTKLGLTPGKTPKGNDSYSEDNLPDNAITKLILQYRHHYKRAHTYFKNYLDLVDSGNILHCSFKQSGTTTGRMSSGDPNLQNVPKRGEDDSNFPVRKCFIPRKGYFLAMIDWDQMEYRMLLDVAGEIETIEKIKSGLDVHTATAEMMGVSREPAKTLNFMLLYGGGAAKLAAALMIAVHKAKELKAIYFRTLRRVQRLVKDLTDTSKIRGFLVNWLGRRILCDEVRPYTSPNHYIQGGCGDVCKVAMNAIDVYLSDKESRLLLQVHDELIFEIKQGEEHILEQIKFIMETTYPHRYLPLTAGVEYSTMDWYNKEKWNGRITCTN